MTPLARQLRDLIAKDGAQSSEHLRRGLRRSSAGRNVPVELIERELRGSPSLFRPTGAGSWDLAENVAVLELPEQRTDVPKSDPMVAGALLDDFVVVDLETTGTDPETDEIVQVSAVRFAGGRPIAALNRYTRAVSTAIPESLRIRMGWPEMTDDQLTDVRVALGELVDFLARGTPVAWNAEFEHNMLRAYDVVLPGLVDAMAVAVLVLPTGPHRLTDFARRVDVVLDELPPGLTIAGERPVGFGAHDAIFDCLLTGFVHAKVVAQLESGRGPTIPGLLPELGPVGDATLAPPQPRRRTRRPTGDAVDNLRRVVDAGGRERRPAQESATSLAAIGLQGRPTLIEAPTGTGKTLGYIAAAVANAAGHNRTALVTAFKNLQDQLVDELVGALDALDADVSFAVLKGGDNYLCKRRLTNVIERLGSDDADLRYVAAVLSRLLDDDPASTREDISWWVLTRHPRALGLVDEVAVSCQHDGCGRAAAIDQANRAQLVVLNQVLWLAPPEKFEPPTCAIVDEAHDLEEMATLAFTEAVGSVQMLALVNRLDPAGRRGLLDTVERFGVDVDRARALARRLRSAALSARLPLARFASAVSSEVDLDRGGRVRLRRSPRLLHPAAWTNAEDSLRDVKEALIALAGTLAEIAGSAQVRDPIAVEDLWDISGRARECEDLLWRLTAVRESAMVHYLEVDGTDGTGWRVARAPVDVSEVLAPVWDSLNGFVLTSATLQTGNHDFTYIVERLGLRGRLAGGSHVIDTDFPFDRNVVFGIARWFDSIPTPRFMEEFVEETAYEITTLARFGTGRQLALFTARRRLEEVGSNISEELARAGIPVLQQGSGARAALLEDFRQRAEAVLLGTRSFWQGVDVPGPSLSFLVLEKLPYPFVRDPVVEARLELVRRKSGNDFDDYLLPQMIITLKQGFGRLVRSRSDRGAVVLLDRRLHVKPYQRRVFDALPGFVPRDPEAERDRKAFYERIDSLLPGLIDDAGRSYLADLESTDRHDLDVPDVEVGGDRDRRRPAVLDAMQRLFGDSFTDFRSVEQEELFWRILDGHDVIGLLPTGAGKSLPFQLAALVTPGVTLVISPLVALMRDQVESLFDKGIRSVGALVGAMSADERDETLRLAEDGRIRLLYVAPERLRDPVFLDRLSHIDANRLVVDEAHCVSLWGPSFRPDFLAIRSALDTAGFHAIPTAALTATATPEIEADIRTSLRIEDALRIATPFGRPELQLAVLDRNNGLPGDRIRNNKERTRLLIRILTAAERNGEAAIVYIPTVREADQIANQLRQVGLLARAYHGRLDAWSRQDVEELFREGEIDVVVATKAFGMGIDRADVRYVIHIGYPADLESYYQEAGRGGRDGSGAHCLLLSLPSDRGTQEWFIDRVAELDEYIACAAAHLRGLGPGEHLVDLDALADELSLDDETQARVILHYLEAAEVVARRTDETVRARVLVLGPLDDSELDTALGRLGAEALVAAEVQIDELSRKMCIEPRDVEARLLGASRAQQLVFRPIERHARIEVMPGAHVVAPDTSNVVRAMQKKLDEMVAYVSSRECRQVLIRRYLGERDVPVCGTCDNCAGTSYPRPWMDVTRDSLPDADRLLDPALTVMAAIDWNASETKAGRNPYGRGALQCVLAADRFNLGRYSEGAERARRIRRAEASPYWGALTLMTNPADRVAAAIDRLFNTEDIETLRHEPEGPAVVTPYEYLSLTEKGRGRLERGLVDG